MVASGAAAGRGRGRGARGARAPEPNARGRGVGSRLGARDRGDSARARPRRRGRRPGSRREEREIENRRATTGSDHVYLPGRRTRAGAAAGRREATHGRGVRRAADASVERGARRRREAVRPFRRSAAAVPASRPSPCCLSFCAWAAFFLSCFGSAAFLLRLPEAAWPPRPGASPSVALRAAARPRAAPAAAPARPGGASRPRSRSDCAFAFARSCWWSFSTFCFSCAWYCCERLLLARRPRWSICLTSGFGAWLTRGATSTRARPGGSPGRLGLRPGPATVPDAGRR